MAFENDGCTGWFDGWPDGPSWLHCCVQHDWKMHSNTEITEWINANLELWWCVHQIDAFMGLIMAVGVFSPIGLALFIWGKKKKGVR